MADDRPAPPPEDTRWLTAEPDDETPAREQLKVGHARTAKVRAARGARRRAR